MESDLRVAGAKLNTEERARLDQMAERINGNRSDVFKAFINYFTAEELAQRLSDVIRDPKDTAVAV